LFAGGAGPYTAQGAQWPERVYGGIAMQKRSLEPAVRALILLVAIGLAGCSPPAPTPTRLPTATSVISITASEIASVRLNDLGAIPAGWMSGGSNPADFIHLETGTNCHTGADCLRFGYQSGGDWAGVTWWPLACGETGTAAAWSKLRNGTCGVNVLKMGNLSAVSRLTFWARGERGGEVVEFKVGGADLPPSPGGSTGKVRLESAWKVYTIDLGKMDMTDAAGLFFWIATDADNPQGAVFYLDDIQFEGMR